MLLRDVVLSFPHLDTKHSYQDSKPRYEATFILSKDHPQYDDFIEIVTAAEKDANGGKKPKFTHPFIKDGGDQDREGYSANDVYFAARSDKKPPKFSAKGERIEIEDEDHPDQPYAGCKVNVKLDIYAYKHRSFGFQHGANMLGVQFAGHGTPFSGAASMATENDFEDISDSASPAMDDDDFMN